MFMIPAGKFIEVHEQRVVTGHLSDSMLLGSAVLKLPLLKPSPTQTVCVLHDPSSAAFDMQPGSLHDFLKKNNPVLWPSKHPGTLTPHLVAIG